MFKEGDTVICMDDSGLPEHHPKIKKGNKYVVHNVKTHCVTVISLGLPMKADGFMCMDCGVREESDGFAYYQATRFRKIEPEYRTVEIAVEVKEQTLIYN